MPRELFDYGLVETNSQYDTYRGSSWELELEGIGISKETMLMACKTASLPTLAVGKENAFHMNDRVQVAGVPEHPESLDVTLHDSIDPDVLDGLYTWFKKIYDFKEGKLGYTSAYKKKGSLFQYAHTGPGGSSGKKREWTIGGAWPSSIAPQELSYESGPTMMEITVSFSVDKFHPK